MNWPDAVALAALFVSIAWVVTIFIKGSSGYYDKR